MQTLKKIGKYKYNERHCLGQGSFGKVFEGMDESGKKVAIKKIEQQVVKTDPYLRQSLHTQIAIMKKLKHKNIVQLIDTVATNNSIYLILQYCSGGDLKRYTNNKKITQNEAQDILKQILQGFYVIVSEGIIHRDLKPANILVHEGVFKICDFGFAKYFGQIGRMAKTCVGTPIYMSPQVLKQKPYTIKTDIWSLGVVFYQLLFKKLPYVGRSQEQIFKLITKARLNIPNCSSLSYGFIQNTLIIDEDKRWDWKHVFQHFSINSQKQKSSGFYIFPNFVNNLFRKDRSQQRKNIVVKEPQNKNQSFRQQKEIFKNGQKQNINFRFLTADNERNDSNQNYPKARHNKMAKNILAQDNQKLSPLITDKNNVKFVQVQKVYKQSDFLALRKIYEIALQFVLRPHRQISSYDQFIFSLISFTLSEYKRQQKYMNSFSVVVQIIMSQQKLTLEKLLNEIKKQPYMDIKNIAGLMQLYGRDLFTDEQFKWIQQLKNICF